MQTQVDVPPLLQLRAGLHSRPLPCCARPGCLWCWSHGESWMAQFWPDYSLIFLTKQAGNLPVLFFFCRPLFTGEATVDLPLTEDTTFPRSSLLQWTELLPPPRTRLHPVLNPGFDHNNYISVPLPARPLVFLTYATLQKIEECSIKDGQMASKLKDENREDTDLKWPPFRLRACIIALPPSPAAPPPIPLWHSAAQDSGSQKFFQRLRADKWHYESCQPCMNTSRVLNCPHPFSAEGRKGNKEKRWKFYSQLERRRKTAKMPHPAQDVLNSSWPERGTGFPSCPGAGWRRPSATLGKDPGTPTNMEKAQKGGRVTKALPYLKFS